MSDLDPKGLEAARLALIELFGGGRARSAYVSNDAIADCAIRAYLQHTPAAAPRGWPQGPFQRYRHYKGGEYEVLDSARHEGTEQHLVLYRKVGTTLIWARPFVDFHCEIGPGIRRFKMIAPILPAPSPLSTQAQTDEET